TDTHSITLLAVFLIVPSLSLSLTSPGSRAFNLSAGLYRHHSAFVSSLSHSPQLPSIPHVTPLYLLALSDAACVRSTTCGAMESQSKGWLWRKKSGEKPSAAAAEKSGLPLRPDDDEVQNLLTEKEELEYNIRILNEKLDSALLDSNAKHSLATDHAKTANEAMEEARGKSLKQELDEALQERAAGEERSAQLDAALKECMQQLRFVREEQERRIHDAVTKASMEFDESRMILEEKLAETGKRLAKLGVENTQLSKALLAKEKTIEELNKQKAQLESDLKDLSVSLEFTEKDNGSLKYEVRVLEKELEIRNEEREFSRRTADASHKQHLESVKKIAKLEAECQRLRLLVRKRLPGPASMAKMRSEAEILGRDSVESRRRRSVTGSGLIMDDYADERSATKAINNLTEQLSAVEEQNKALVEALGKKESELQSSRAMFARAASRLSPPVDSRIYESPKWRTSLELSKLGLVPHDISLSSVSEAGSDDKVSSAESWPCALTSEPEHSKHGKKKGSLSRKSIGAPDMDLMDDFAEMERLAIVSVDKQQSGSPQLSSSNSSAVISPFKPDLIERVTGMEIVPVLDSGLRQSSDTTSAKAPDWLQEILKLVREQNRVTKRKPDEILEEIRVALANVETISPTKDADGTPVNSSTPISGYLLWKSKDKTDTTDFNGAANDIDVPHSDLGKSVSKILELVEGIARQNPGCTNNSESVSSKDSSSFPYKSTDMTMGYTVRVFQWKTSELSAVLQQFIHVCYDLLSNKCNVSKFAQELTSALDWIINHCFSLQDVSSMKEAIKKHLDWDSKSEGDHGEVGIISNEKDEGKKFNSGLADMISAKEALEERLKSATEKSESLTLQVQESEKTSASLQSELDNVGGSRGSIENQIEAHRVVKEDLDTQLVMAKAELSEARRKLSSLEVELDNRNSCCEDLEATCVDLQLQLESVTENTTPKTEVHPEDQLRTNWEIAAASENLAECQETILNLGKQLKALASPNDAAIIDKVVSKPDEVNTTPDTATGATPRATLTNQRSSLLDRMLAEDSVKATANAAAEPLEKILNLNKSKHHNDDDGVTVNSLAIVPSRKHGIGGLWRKLLRKKKKSAAGQKPPIAFPK
ncbi:unnamed protein product, partial [Linum tenue]